MVECVVGEERKLGGPRFVVESRVQGWPGRAERATIL